MAETAPTSPTSPLKTPGDLDSGVSGDSICGGGSPAMLDRIGSNKASNNISSRSNSPSSPPTSPRPTIRSNAAAGSPLRNEVQDVRMGVWHTHKYDSPFTATIDGLQQFWDAWTVRYERACVPLNSSHAFLFFSLGQISSSDRKQRTGC